MSETVFQHPAEDAPRSRAYEVKGTWAFVTWGSMVTIALVPFTNAFVPGTNRQYSIMSVTQLFFWACMLLSPRVLKRGYSPILVWMAVLFGIRYVYGALLSNFPAIMEDSTRNMIRPMVWAWILTAVMRDATWRKRGCDFFVLGCAIAAALHLSGLGVGEAIVGVGGAERISAFELNPNVLGVIYSTGFIICFARVVQPHNGYAPLVRIAFAGAGVLLLSGLLLTGSRTAAIFLALGCMILLVVEMRRARWSRPAILATMLLSSAALGLGFSNSVIAARSERVVDAGVGTEDRARMAPILLDQFLRSPIYGLGPENYRVELGIRSGTGEPRVGIVAHNQLFMFAVEMGLFGLVPFLAICALVLWEAWKVRIIEGGLELALAAPCVLTACTVANIAFHWHFHFIVGLVAGAYGAYRDQAAQAR